MKVLLVSSNSGSRGGGEIYLQRLAEGLADLGHAVHALVATDSAMDELAAQLGESSRVARLDLTNMYQRKARVIGALLDRAQIARLERCFRELDPAVVHLNQQVAEDGLDGLRAARRAGLAAVSTIHIPGSPRALGAVAGGLRGYLARRELERSDGMHIAVSETSGRQLSAWLPFLEAEDRLRPVHNGVPSAVGGEAAQANRERYRAEWGVTAGQVVLGCVGRIEAQKNPMLLVELAQRLVRGGADVRFVWVGDGRLRGEVEQAVTSRGLADRFRIDGWQNDAAQRMLGFDVFALPSRFEGLPLALLEALSAGLPCCASRADGIPEAITDGENGRLCDPDDPEEWLGALSGLVGDAEERNRLGEAARRTASERFSIEAMARRTLAVYEEAIERFASGGAQR